MHTKLNLATLLNSTAQYEEAAVALRPIEEWYIENNGPQDATTVLAINNLAVALQHSGHEEEALALLERALDAKLQILPAGHPSLLISFSTTARIMRKVGDEEGAERLYDEAIEMGIAAHGRDQYHVKALEFQRAELLIATGRLEQAKKILKELIPRVEATDPADSLFLKAVRRISAQIAGQSG
ncbi:MAG: tetratricopeptide (TPR) repeat protein [Candidatus Paceibacteria bacterium]|jgi:tetratricopeptide (TPR) repeat protein